MTVEDLLKLMLNFFQEIDKETKESYEKLSILDLKQQDILHYIEATTLNASGYSKAGKLLKQVRTERRDLDNVCFAKKFILDSMVKAGKLKDDNRNFVKGFRDDFEYGKSSKVILEIEEIK